jgi:secreted trypsin-like serine protease
MILLYLATSHLACAERPLFQKGEISNPHHEDQGIVGGTNVGLLSKDAERVVLITGKINGKSYLCSGVLIANDVILTAAHCLGEPKNIKIVFGPDPVHTGAVQITKLKSFLKHKGYNPNVFIRNDLALIQTEDKKPENYKIAKLPWESSKSSYKSSILKTDTVVKVMGYGTMTGLPAKNKMDRRGEGTLRATALTLTKFSPSQDVFYADQTTGHAICFGDSGGPAFIATNTVVGVVSYNIIDDPYRPDLADADVCNYQAVFTNLIQYKNWILNGLKTLRSPTINSI